MRWIEHGPPARGRAAAVLLVALAVLGGCGQASVESAEQRARLDREQADRMEQLERVEVRLLDAGARRGHWSELKRRHEDVSALACADAAEHVAAVLRNEEKLERARRRARGRAVAAAPPPVSVGPPANVVVDPSPGEGGPPPGTEEALP